MGSHLKLCYDFRSTHLCFVTMTLPLLWPVIFHPEHSNNTAKRLTHTLTQPSFTQVFKQQGGNHWKLPFSPQGPFCPAVPVCWGGEGFWRVGVSGQRHQHGTRCNKRIPPEFQARGLGLRHTALPVLSSTQPSLFSGDQGSPQVHSSVSFCTWD